MKTINFNEFVDKFRPITNHFDNNSSYDGFMFETFGEDLEFVSHQHYNNKSVQVWTIIEEDERYAVPRMQLVNRLGFFITSKKSEEKIIVEL